LNESSYALNSAALLESESFTDYSNYLNNATTFYKEAVETVVAGV